MKIKLITALVTLGVAAVPASASARWSITQRQAESYVKQAAYQEYDVSRYDSAGACRPKGIYGRRGQFYPGTYHAWVCGWASDDLTGLIAIKGTTSRTYGFMYVVLRGAKSY